MATATPTIVATAPIATAPIAADCVGSAIVTESRPVSDFLDPFLPVRALLPLFPPFLPPFLPPFFEDGRLPVPPVPGWAVDVPTVVSIPLSGWVVVIEHACAARQHNVSESGEDLRLFFEIDPTD